MRPRRLPLFFFTAVLLLVLPVTVVLLYFPPRPLLHLTLEKALGSQIHWDSVARAGIHVGLVQVEVPLDRARVRVSRADLMHSLFWGLCTQTWFAELKGISVMPANGAWPSLEFDTGRIGWVSSRRRLEVDLNAESAELHGTFFWQPAVPLRDARLEHFEIRGRARMPELGKLLARWKAVPATGSASETEWKDFEMTYEAGKFAIRVDSKPFFRASWR